MSVIVVGPSGPLPATGTGRAFPPRALVWASGWPSQSAHTTGGVDSTPGACSVSVLRAGHRGVARAPLPVKAVGGPLPVSSLPVLAGNGRYSCFRRRARRGGQDCRVFFEGSQSVRNRGPYHLSPSSLLFLEPPRIPPGGHAASCDTGLWPLDTSRGGGTHPSRSDPLSFKKNPRVTTTELRGPCSCCHPVQRQGARPGGRGTVLAGLPARGPHAPLARPSGGPCRGSRCLGA